MASLTKKIINGRPYYYLRETARVGGRPKVVRTTYLGRAEDLARRLELARGEPKEVRVRSFGAVAAALRVCRTLEVQAAIDAVCRTRIKGPSVGELVALAAINRAVCPRSKRQLADWYGRTALARLQPQPASALSSQRFWTAMDHLSDEQIRAAEERIVGRAIERYEIELRPLVYDTTNFATFVDSANERNQIARRGHAKGGRRDLRLVGLALAVALDANVPLCHELYAGNTNDASEFPHALELIRSRLEGLSINTQERSQLTLIYDKGNNSAANQALADELGLGLVGSLTPAHHAELLAVGKDRFIALRGIAGTTAYRTRVQLYGRERTVLITHSQSFEQKQARSFAQTLAKARSELVALQGVVQRGRHRMDERALSERVAQILARRWLAEVLAVDCDPKQRRFHFRTERRALARVREREWGKRIIFTDRHEWPDEEIVAAYRAQASAERAFRQMKDTEFASFQPVHHWTDQKLRVHAFYCTLALMIVTLIERQARRVGIQLGSKLALRSLSEIHETTLIYPPAGGKQGRPRTRTALATIDPLQRQLLDALELNALTPV
jgi:transposase